MSAIPSSTASALSESAVCETVKQVSARALDLLTRQGEINRQILHLRRMMKGLRDNSNDGPVAAPACVTIRKVLQGVGQVQSPPLRDSRDRDERLARACRIALMEAAVPASSDELCKRIARRGSFSFTDAGSADAAITQTLEAMANSGELSRLEATPKGLWQRANL
jgi:hypothetical protein